MPGGVVKNDVPTNFSNLKSKVDKLDVDKLVHVPVDLSKLSDVVKNDVAKLKNVTSNKNELNVLSKKLKAISTKGLTKDLINKFSILNEAKYFSSGIFQNYLVFIPVKKYIKYFSGTTLIDMWKSNGMSEENIENVTKSDSDFAPTFVDHHVIPDINFNGHCLINNIYIHKKINKYIYFFHSKSTIKKCKHRFYIR